MAYSDYGGYAYRNGARVIERSDFTLTPDGKGFESAGCWPGFTAIMNGMNQEEVEKIASMPNGHAVIGDGPIFVCLYKQSCLSFYNGFEKIEKTTLLKQGEYCIKLEYGQEPWQYIDTDEAVHREQPYIFEIDGCKITVYWLETDNYYQYVEMIQPDGVIWHAFSGYGVGAGFEDCGYGYNTNEQEKQLFALFKRHELLEQGSD